MVVHTGDGLYWVDQLMQKQHKYRVCVTVQAAKPYQAYTEHYTLTAALRHIRVLIQDGLTSPVRLVTLPNDTDNDED